MANASWQHERLFIDGTWTAGNASGAIDGISSGLTAAPLTFDNSVGKS